MSWKACFCGEGKGWNILKDNVHFHSDFRFSFWLPAPGEWGLLVPGITVSEYLLSPYNIEGSLYVENVKYNEQYKTVIRENTFELKQQKVHNNSDCRFAHVPLLINEIIDSSSVKML